MREVLLSIQYITIGMLFTEIGIVLVGWKSRVHSYLFLACITSFVSNMGYLLEMKATTEEAYLTALKLSYLGRVWIAFAWFLFAAKLCRKKIPKGVIAALALTLIGVYITILTIENNTLYYPSWQFVYESGLSRFNHENGYVHDLLMGMNVVFSVMGMWWLVSEYRHEKIKKANF